MSEERGRALLPFIGQYVAIALRKSRVTDDQAGEGPPQRFIGILARFDATTINLVGAVKVNDTRDIDDHLRSGFVADASPLFITAQFKSLSSVARCSRKTMLRIFRDGLRGLPLLPVIDSPEGKSCCAFLTRMMVRRYVATQLADQLHPPPREEDTDEEGANAEDPKDVIERLVTTSVGGVPPTNREPAARIRMPITRYVAQAVKSLTRVNASAADAAEAEDAAEVAAEIDEAQADNATQVQLNPVGHGPRGVRVPTAAPGVSSPPNTRSSSSPASIRVTSPPRSMEPLSVAAVYDSAPIAQLLKEVPAALGAMPCADLRTMLAEECGTVRALFQRRRQSPMAMLQEVVYRAIKYGFLFTICLSVLNCVLGGIILGSALSGPLTSAGSLVTKYAGYMWYLLILPGLLIAVHGVILSARGEEATIPVSRVARVWLTTELIIIVLMLPGFIFAAMFVDRQTTPRHEYKTPEMFWLKLASKSDNAVCKYMEDERCSGYYAPCFVAANESVVFLYQRPDCPQDCAMSLAFLRAVPVAVCSTKMVDAVRTVSKQTIGFFVAFVCLILARFGGLYVIRKIFTPPDIIAHYQALVAAQQTETTANNAQQPDTNNGGANANAVADANAAADVQPIPFAEAAVS
jgi:hypothetical protein